MKTFSVLLITFLSSISVLGQDITGQWNGILKVAGMQLRIVFHVTKSDYGFTATMDSPDQGANGMVVTKTTFENPKIKFEVANPKIEYSGELKGKQIVGAFNQGGQVMPMNLSRDTIAKETVRRPQEPTNPYPYYSEEITFQNSSANISLSGTLTLPDKNGVFPFVILITGSGPQNRDEELMGHKPFLIIADYLTKNGIAVLRFDDRGVGQSKGNFSTATSADFATDVESAIAYIKTRKEIDKNKIGLIGHSEGGIIAPMVASKSKDVSFIVLLAGTGISGDKLLLMQQELIAKISGAPEADIKKSVETSRKLIQTVVSSTDKEKMKSELTTIIEEALVGDTIDTEKDEFIATILNQYGSPWMQYFLKFDPAPTLEKVKCSVLALNGEKDLQVPPKENLTAIKAALEKGGNKNVTTKVFPNLNHLFQECKTGLPAEYPTIEQTFSPLALAEISTWIKLHTK